MSLLYQRLTEGEVTRDPGSEENSLVSRFVPSGVLAKELSSDSIAANLSWPHWILYLLSSSLPIEVHRQAPKVFAILVLITHESAISKLISQDNITDDDLPLARGKPGQCRVVSPSNSGKKFLSFASWPQPKVDQFLEKQWTVLAPVLETTQHSKLLARQPLPITKSNLIKAQGTRVFIHQAWFHPDHAPFAASGSPVAIKEFRDKHVFAREKEILDRIADRGNKHLIHLLASYETSSSYCLVFKWANGGNLRDFWSRQDSTTRSPDLTLWSLQQMLGLVDAVRFLHEDGTRHGDIKPLNILHFIQDKSGQGILILADVGISKYHHQNTGLRHEATMTDEATWEYEAPEAEKSHPSHNQPRSRRYDSWSIGCIFLEFAVWLLYGFDAVRTFQDRRKTPDPFNEYYYDRYAAFFKRDFTGLHPVVKRAFVVLRGDPRCRQGMALGDLLTLIETKLLRIDPNNRATAKELQDQLAIIAQRALKEGASYLGTLPQNTPKRPTFFRRRRSTKTMSEASRSSADSSISFGSSPVDSASPNSSGSSLPSIDDL